MATEACNASNSGEIVTKSLPDYGHRPIAYRLDDLAAAEPERALLLKPRSSRPDDGWEPVTRRAFADAVNCAAHLISAKVKADSAEEFPTIAYIGTNDIRYGIIMIAAIKAGCQALFISPRNSLEAQLALFEQTSCRHLWYSGPFQSIIESIASHRKMDTFVAPSLDQLLSSNAVRFPYERPPEKTEWDPAVVLHTSGSTGVPKPVVFRQGGLIAMDQYQHLPPRNGARYIWSEYTERCKRTFAALPFFHGAGLMGAFVLLCLYHEHELAVPIPDQPMTADLLIESIKYSGSESGFTAPSILEELSGRNDGIECLKGLKFVAYGGGNLSPTAGNILRKHGIVISNAIATTEHLPWPMFWQSNYDDWRYFVFNSEAMGVKWRPHDPENGIYELVVKRTHPTEPAGQAAFYNFPDWEEYAPGDLFKAHPTAPDNWMYYGRKDNIIVFSNGEKLNPVTMEDTITGHPLIKGALVVGQGRFQAAVILEPVTHPETEAQAAELIDQVWPTIEEANQSTVAHGRLGRQFVSLSHPNTPFPRAGKGTIQRGLAILSCKDKINAIYERADLEQLDIAPFDLSSQDALAKSIVQSLMEQLKTANIEPKTEFFSIGIDSLQVLTIAKILYAGLKAAGKSVSREAVAPRVVYNNPTSEKLAGHLYSMLNSNEGFIKDEVASQTALAEKLVAKYTQDMPSFTTDKPEPLSDGQTVLLTGSTGSLGAYMLDVLCKAPQVKRVIAPNRGADGGKSRQPEINAARSLGTDFGKVKFVGVDISQPKFGIEDAEYDNLLSSVDRIVHNAWPVNFNLNVSSFEPHIRGVRNLVEFSSKAAKAVPIVFLSSIGTVMNWKQRCVVPEKQLPDFHLTAMGYGQSKLAGSLILDAAATQSGIPTASIRVGQIAGPKQGAGKWNPQEFIPSLIASSVHFGVLPDSIGPQSTLDWMPIEDVAGLVLDVAGVTQQKPSSDIRGYFHCVNPKTVQWTEVAAAVKDYYSPRIKKLVSIEEWVTIVEKSAEGSPDLDKNPAVKLLDTYRGFAQAEKVNQSHVYLSMKKTMEQSKTAASTGVITADLMRTWCEQWNF